MPKVGQSSQIKSEIVLMIFTRVSSGIKKMTKLLWCVRP